MVSNIAEPVFLVILLIVMSGCLKYCLQRTFDSIDEVYLLHLLNTIARQLEPTCQSKTNMLLEVSSDSSPTADDQETRRRELLERLVQYSDTNTNKYTIDCNGSN